jgi:hypothetical protein
MWTMIHRIGLLLLVMLIGMDGLDAKVMRKKRRGSSQRKSQLLRNKRRRRQRKSTPLVRKKRRKRVGISTAIPREAVPSFSKTICRFFTDNELAVSQQLPGREQVVWAKEQTDPFGELIVSWNALRPTQGHLAIWVSVLHHGQWSSWHKLAIWGHKVQKTFLHKSHPAVHTIHNRVTLQNGNLARGFRVKVTFHKGAAPSVLKALFACTSRLNQHKIIQPDHQLPTAIIHKKHHTRISQFMLDHERKGDICAPVSTAMMVSYFFKQKYGQRPHYSMANYAIDFTKKVHDQGDLNVFGNWHLNVAQAFDAMKGDVYFSVQRLNSFYDLHHYLAQEVPVVVSVRRLPGGATPYAGGHLLMIIGYDSSTRRVICLDPAFSPHHATLQSYPLMPFIRAWGRSSNMSYVPLLKSMVGQREAPPIAECIAANDKTELLEPVASDLLSTPQELLQVASLHALPDSEVTEDLLAAEAFEQA